MWCTRIWWQRHEHRQWWRRACAHMVIQRAARAAKLHGGGLDAGAREACRQYGLGGQSVGVALTAGLADGAREMWCHGPRRSPAAPAVTEQAPECGMLVWIRRL